MRSPLRLALLAAAISALASMGRANPVGSIPSSSGNIDYINAPNAGAGTLYTVPNDVLSRTFSSSFRIPATGLDDVTAMMNAEWARISAASNSADDLASLRSFNEKFQPLIAKPAVQSLEELINAGIYTRHIPQFSADLDSIVPIVDAPASGAAAIRRPTSVADYMEQVQVQLVRKNALVFEQTRKTVWDNVAAKLGTSGANLKAGVIGVAGALVSGSRRAETAATMCMLLRYSGDSRCAARARVQAGAGISYLASDGSCTAFDGRCGGCRSFYGENSALPATPEEHCSVTDTPSLLFSRMQACCTPPTRISPVKGPF